jgi:TPR repeat protein
MNKRRTRKTFKTKNKNVNKKQRAKNKKTGGSHTHKSGTSPTRKTLSGLSEVDPALRLAALVGPGSGTANMVVRSLTNGFPWHTPLSVHRLAASAVESGQNPGLANALRVSAQRLRANSLLLTDRDTQSCAAKNQQAAELLMRAVKLGSAPARAELADMWLHGPVGIPLNLGGAEELVSKVDDADCKGVMAQIEFVYEDYDEAFPLARESAAKGSKYGQFAFALLSEIYRSRQPQEERDQGAASLELAAGQNYDLAQAKLGLQNCVRGGVPARPRALELLHLAAKQGNADAFEPLAKLEYMNKNKAECMRWCVLARDTGCRDGFVLGHINHPTVEWDHSDLRLLPRSIFS